MKTSTISSLPSSVTQCFNKKLLFTFLESIQDKIENDILPLARKKIRAVDIGKQRQLEWLLTQYKIEYERKKIAEAEYKTKIKEKIEKRPSLSATGGTCTFKRMGTRK